MENSIFKTFISFLDKENIIKYTNLYQAQEPRVRDVLIEEIFSNIGCELLGIDPDSSKPLSEKVSDQERLAQEIKKLKVIYSSVFNKVPLGDLYDLSKLKGPCLAQTNLNNYFTSYEQVTRNIFNRTEMENRKLPTGYDQKILSLLKEGNWKGLSSDDMKNFCCQILQLFHQKKITYRQFTTCVFYWSLRQEYKPEQISIIPLFENDKINPVAKKAILETFESQEMPFCNEEHCRKFFEAMKNEPEAEKFFFAVDRDPKSEKNYNTTELKNPQTVTEALRELGFNVFDECHIEREISREEEDQQQKQALLRIESYDRRIQEYKNSLQEIYLQNDKYEKLIEKTHILNRMNKVLKGSDLDFDNSLIMSVKEDLKNRLNQCQDLEEHIKELEILRDKQKEKIQCVVEARPKLRRIQSDIFSINEILGDKEEIEPMKNIIPEKKCMIASFSMMQTLLDITLKGILFCPTIGLSTLNDIKNNGIFDTRDMGIPFEGIDIPDEADSYKIKRKYQFWKHDFYHGFVASMAPSSHRKVFIKFAEVLKKTSLKMIPELKNKIIERLIDMETVSYFNHEFKKYGQDSSKMMFLYFIDSVIIHTAMQSLDAQILLSLISHTNEEITYKLGGLASLSEKEGWMKELTELFLKEFHHLDLNLKNENRVKLSCLLTYDKLLNSYVQKRENSFIHHFLELTSDCN